jgi:ribosomal protein L16 Arg81 hydroxylase
MRSFQDLLYPVTLEKFRAEHEDRAPLHIPADADASKRRLLDWTEFNGLLDLESIWTPNSLKLLIDGEQVEPGRYCSDVRTPLGVALRPAPAKVQRLLAQGASLIAEEVEALTPALSHLASQLSRQFAAQVGANVYCSFAGIQAFETHFDLHHVFAVQLEGEKTWRLYRNRAHAPVDYPVEAGGIRPWFAQTSGPLMQEIRMRPGDVLYLPRGWYHDALATEGASLHVTFSVTPLYGRILFRLLEAAALQDPAFRAWFPPAETDSQRLQAHLTDLGQRLARLMALPEFFDEIAMTQETLVRRRPPYSLPERRPSTLYKPTSLAGPVLHGPAAIALGWALRQPQVSLEDLIAEFDYVSEDTLRGAIASAERAGALRRV